MARQTLSSQDRIQYGFDVLKTTVSQKTKKILVQIGNAVSKAVDSDNVEWLQHVGLVSTAASAESGKRAAQVVVIRLGDRDVAINSTDLRGLELAGELGDGETVVYAAGKDGKGQARTIYKNDGSIHHYTRVGNSESGAGMTVQIDAQGNAIRILNGSGFGLIIDKDGVTLTAGEAALTLNADGSHSLIGTGTAQVDGTSILLGAQGVPGANSAIMGPAGVAGAPNPKIILGT